MIKTPKIINTIEDYINTYCEIERKLKSFQHAKYVIKNKITEKMKIEPYPLKDIIHIIDDIYIGSLYHLNQICIKLNIEDASSILLKEITEEYKDKHRAELIWILEVQVSDKVFYIIRKRRHGSKKSECIICQTKEKFIDDMNYTNAINKLRKFMG